MANLVQNIFKNALITLIHMLLVFNEINTEHSTLYYKIQDRLPRNKLIAVISRDPILDLPKVDSTEIHFTDVITHIWSTVGGKKVTDKLFTIDKETGALKTARQISKKEICTDKNCCKITLDLTLNFKDKFKPLRILIDIADKLRDGKQDYVLSKPDRNQKSIFLKYTITEEIPMNIFIGDISRDSGLSEKLTADIWEHMRFEILKIYTGFNQRCLEILFIIYENGLIKTAKLIDREDICPEEEVCNVFIDIKLKSEEYVRNETIMIKIIDQNDNSPKYENDLVSINVTDSTNLTSGTVLPRAIDLDSPAFGIKNYYIASVKSKNETVQEKYFALEVIYNKNQPPVPKLKVTKSVLDNFRTQYQIEIVAIDYGNPPKSGTLLVNLNILKANLYTPSFTKDIYEVAIYENNRINDFLLRVNAFDPDNKNNKVRYQLNSTNITFSSISDTGVITLNTILDYEISKHFSFVVLAIDNGYPGKTASASVMVTVVDTNDCMPYFLSDSYIFTITENMPVNSVVGKVTAYDKDEYPHNITSYRLEAFDVNALYNFRIETHTGVISTFKALDKEIQSAYNFTAIVYNRGSFAMSATTKITVFVNDANDNMPIIVFPSTNNYTLDIGKSYTSLEIGEVLTKVRAYDEDSGANANLSYYLYDFEEDIINPLNTLKLNISTSKHFDIDADGFITLKEKLHNETNIQAQRLSVVVTDNGEPQQATKAILVLNYLLDYGADLVKTDLNAGYPKSITDNSNDVPFFLLSGNQSFPISLIILFISGCNLMIMVLILIVMVFSSRNRGHL